MPCGLCVRCRHAVAALPCAIGCGLGISPVPAAPVTVIVIVVRTCHWLGPLTVIVVVPAVSATMLPLASTVATAGLLLVYIRGEGVPLVLLL